MTEPDDRISIDDLVMRYTKQDLDEAYERGKAEQQESLNAARQLATQLGQNADEAIRAAYEQGRVRGLREATEGWERNLRWRTAVGQTFEFSHDSYVAPYVQQARRLERQYGYEPGELQQRLVGPWEPAEPKGSSE